MKKQIFKFVLACTAFTLLFSACSQQTEFETTIELDKEEITPDQYRYTPSTQSFLRGHHWLKNISTAKFSVDKNSKASIDFLPASDSEYFFKAKNIPVDYLVPRLHYSTKKDKDEFDYFNLMLAEYSRNGLSFPFGREGDEMTHFQTNLEASIPWNLKGDYEFEPNPTFKPIRFSVVNNCLSPSLWELSATDKTGEIYHAWFNMPQDHYYDLVASTNDISKEAAKQALEWKSEPVKLDLDRLRVVKKQLSTSKISTIDEEISYSTQGSRQKLSKGFVNYVVDGEMKRPKVLSDLLHNKVKMAKFEKPGKYSMENKMEFDFEEYEKPLGVTINEVDPLTSYKYNKQEFRRDQKRYIEIIIDLPEKKKLIFGNLPLELLVQQEDFAINGFGVGILSAGGFAERRMMLIEAGYHPSYAYLAQETADGLVALNSHDEGLEQVFIRSYPGKTEPCWTVTLASYERITDIVKYQISMSPELVEHQLAHTDHYITPVYFSYRDDNVR